MNNSNDEHMKVEMPNGQSDSGRCPLCGQPRIHDYRPFCSKRCADVDLGRWLSGSYVVAGSKDSEEDGEPDAEQLDIASSGNMNAKH